MLSRGRYAGVILAELAVTEESGLANGTIGEIVTAVPGVTVLGVMQSDGSVVAGSQPSLRLQSGDQLIVLGPEQEMQRLSRR